MKRKQSLKIGAVALTVALVFIGLQVVYSWTGTNNYFSPGYVEVEYVNVTEFYRQDQNYTAWIQADIEAQIAAIPDKQNVTYDYDYYMHVEGSYFVSYDARDGSVVANSTDAKVTYNITRARLTQFGGIKCGPGTFVSSGKIYLQSEGGGGIPDFDNGLIFDGTGRPGASGMDQNATRWQFPAGSDGFIVDMDTNGGQWYTSTIIRNMAIHGASGSEMATCVKVIKGAHFELHNIYTWYAGAGGVAHFNITNGQDWLMTSLRANLNINNSIGFLVQNIDGASRGYTEQGAHGTAINLKSGVPNGAYEGMVNFWLTVPSGTAVLSQHTWINCESMISDDSGTGTGHTGWKYGNGADTAGIRTQTTIGSNYEGGTYASGDRAIYEDANGKVVRVKVISGGFASGSGIEFDASGADFTLENCEPEPATVDTGPGTIRMEGTDEPASATGNFEATIAPYILGTGLDFMPNTSSDVWVAHGCVTEPDSIVLIGASDHAEATSFVIAFSSTNATHFRVYYKPVGGGTVSANRYFYWIALSNILAAMVRFLLKIP